MVELLLPADYADLLRDFVTEQVEFVIVGGWAVAVIGRAALVANKRAAGRPKDLADVAALGDDADEA